MFAAGNVTIYVTEMERAVRFHGVAEEGKAGRFAHFEDPDGNLLYLAELNWQHVDRSQGQYRRG